MKVKSIEKYILIKLFPFAVLLLVLVFLLLNQAQWLWWQNLLILFFTGSILMVSVFSFRKRLTLTFERALLHIEAVRQEDYNQHAKADFSEGCVGEFHYQLKALSADLLANKSRYDQHVFLVYQLIDQLNTPILVFNQQNMLTYANGAFSHLYQQPWQMFRLASPKLLGLKKVALKNQPEKRHYILTDNDKNNQWQISQSEFIDQGQTHQLLVFTNIESALRASQLNAWQQIIRVMGHEIRNSLTPVSSIAESLAMRNDNKRDQQALALISERCHHLQDFVSRYSSLNQTLNLTLKKFDIIALVERLQGLFVEENLSIVSSSQFLLADETFIEQVLINLIKNASEAGAKTIKVNFYQQNDTSLIDVIDDGHGFANVENLFVPLYSTKPEGQGIGLSFCRNIIEQHQGSIRLVNNETEHGGVGVSVHLSLPFYLAPR